MKNGYVKKQLWAVLVASCLLSSSLYPMMRRLSGQGFMSGSCLLTQICRQSNLMPEKSCEQASGQPLDDTSVAPAMAQDSNSAMTDNQKLLKEMEQMRSLLKGLKEKSEENLEISKQPSWLSFWAFWFGCLCCLTVSGSVSPGLKTVKDDVSQVRQDVVGIRHDVARMSGVRYDIEKINNEIIYIKRSEQENRAVIDQIKDDTSKITGELLTVKGQMDKMRRVLKRLEN